MESPFPGMDPWLENLWGDFHARLIPQLSDLIQPLLPPDLRCRIEQEVLVEPAEDGAFERLRPDAHLHVGEASVAYDTGEGAAAASVACAVPTRVVQHTPFPQRSLHIRNAKHGGRLIASIELLSPTNKRRGIGLDAYHRKQDAMLAAGVNLLELDLLRGGSVASVAAREGISEEAPSPHHFSLFNVCRDVATEYYAIAFGDPLPCISLPLRHADETIGLDVQSAVAETKRRGRYARDFDYTGDPPGPPLSPEERAWLDERLAAAGG